METQPNPLGINPSTMRFLALLLSVLPSIYDTEVHQGCNTVTRTVPASAISRPESSGRGTTAAAGSVGRVLYAKSAVLTVPNTDHQYAVLSQQQLHVGDQLFVCDNGFASLQLADHGVNNIQPGTRVKVTRKGFKIYPLSTSSSAPSFDIQMPYLSAAVRG